MFRVLLDYDCFSNLQDQKIRVGVFEDWFNQILHNNAAKPGSAPMGYSSMVKILGRKTYKLRTQGWPVEPVGYKCSGNFVEYKGYGNVIGRVGGEGLGEASGGRGAGPRPEEVGMVVQERRKAFIGTNRLCVDFSHGGCQGGEKKIGGCRKFGGSIFIHKCAVIKKLNPIELCGGDHEAKDCTIAYK
jgi:hypothetical protein